MRPIWPLLLAFSGAFGCERTPHEDLLSTRPWAPVPSGAAQPPPNASAGTGATSPAGRCVLPTPPSAPAAVPAGPSPGCPPDPESPAAPGIVVHLMFPDAPGALVEAELVRSPHDTARGLMYRTRLAEDHGMLFDLAVRDEHKFWMHNTCIPLDLLYVDDDGLIVGIVENAPTLNDESRGVGCPSVYVLEVNAGWARRHAVRAGQHMSIPALVRGK